MYQLIIFRKTQFFPCSVLLSVRSDLSVPFWVVRYLPHGLLVWNVLEFSRNFRRLRRSILIHRTPFVRPFTCPGSTRPLLLKIYSGGLQLVVVVPKFHDQILDCEVTFFARQQKFVPPLFQTMPYRPDVPDRLLNNGRTPSTGKGSVYQTRGLGYMRRKWWRLKWVVLKCYTLYAICLPTVTLPISLYKLSNDRLLHYSTTFFCSDLNLYIFLLLMPPW